MWGVVLRIEFVPINNETGDVANPSEDVYFKILPKGSSNIPGILLGYLLLDVEPYGFGWERKVRSHYFTRLKVHPLRGELHRRKDHTEAVKQWHTEDVEGSQSGKEKVCRIAEQTPGLSQKQMTALFDEGIRAIYTGPELILEPGDGALVPTHWVGTWNGKPPPASFLAASTDECAVSVRPGVCPGETLDIMLCSENDTVALKSSVMET